MTSEPPFDTRHYGIDYDRVYDEDEDFMIDNALGQSVRIEADCAEEALIKLVDQCPTGIQEIHWMGLYEPGEESPVEIDKALFEDHGIEALCFTAPYVVGDGEWDNVQQIDIEDSSEERGQGFHRDLQWVMCECGERFEGPNALEKYNEHDNT